MLLDDIKKVFASNGALSKHLTTYERRDGQAEMSELVGKAFLDGRHLIVEAPTGTGKSFAYLVPAILKTLAAKRTVIATANITLQEQLVNIDLPFLRRVMGIEFTFGLAKGMNNYLCSLKYDQLNEHELPSFTKRYLKRVRGWAEHTDTGDKSELVIKPPDVLWRKISATSDDCRRRICRFFDVCYPRAARKSIASKNIVVCNYHLLFANTAMKISTGEGTVLPVFSYLIFDEGHRAADIAREFFGKRVSPFRFARLSSDCLRASARSTYGAQNIMGFSNVLREMGKHLFIDVRDYYDEFHPAILEEPGFVEYEQEAGLLAEYIEVLEYAATNEPDKRSKADLKIYLKRAESVLNDLRECMEQLDPTCVYFINEEEFDKQPSASVESNVVEPGEMLNRFLFADTEATIFTSATMQVDNSFEYVAQELGVRDYDSAVVESAFDIDSNVQLVIPWMRTDPREYGFADELADIVREVIRIADGRCLVLFTSYKNMWHVFKKVKNDFSFPLYIQGEDLNRSQLIESFKRNVHSVLFGTESFWSGVDIPGEALSCVIMDKIPFPVKDDPVLSALEARGEKVFFKHSIPRAVIALRQGFGRLIRRRSDRGFVVITDDRLFSKSYGALILRSLPKTFDTRELSDMESYLDD